MSGNSRQEKAPASDHRETAEEQRGDVGFRANECCAKGSEIDLATAIARRLAGLDIVVCGDDLKANYDLAMKVESAVGPWERQGFHKRPGPQSLPHLQPSVRPPEGHSFYETDNPKRKARRLR